MSAEPRSRALRGAAIAVGLFGVAALGGCGASEEAPSFVSIRVIGPMRPDRETAERIGRQALAEYGYEEIIRLAFKARFLRYPDPPERHAGNLVGQTLEDAARKAWPVFTEYAVAAGITSQLDSPAPGPADVIALGELVVGLFHAGVIGVMVLTMTSDSAGSTTTTTAAPIAPPVSMATALPTTLAPTMPTTLPLADQKRWRKCNQLHDDYKKAQDDAADLATRMDPITTLLHNNKASAKDRAKFCSMLHDRIKVKEREDQGRRTYMKNGCDDFDWFNTGKKAAVRLAGHATELKQVEKELKNLHALKDRFCE